MYIEYKKYNDDLYFSRQNISSCRMYPDKKCDFSQDTSIHQLNKKGGIEHFFAILKSFGMNIIILFINYFRTTRS